MRNKKGISIIVSYVLLIVIAVGVSVAVYSYLRLQVPKERNECSSEIALAIQDYQCDINAETLDLTIINRGLFNVDRASIRLGAPETTIKEQIQISVLYEDGLDPGESITLSYNVPEEITLQEEMVVEIVPILFEDDQLVLCENSIINQPITCTTS